VHARAEGRTVERHNLLADIESSLTILIYVLIYNMYDPVIYNMYDPAQRLYDFKCEIYGAVQVHAQVEGRTVELHLLLADLESSLTAWSSELGESAAEIEASFRYRNPQPESRNPKPESRNPNSESRNPNPETRNFTRSHPKPEGPNSKPQTPNPNHQSSTPKTQPPNP